MYTRCTYCDSWLKITADQLCAGLGQVRCGSCVHVFNALTNLTDATPDLPQLEPVQPVPNGAPNAAARWSSDTTTPFPSPPAASEDDAPADLPLHLPLTSPPQLELDAGDNAWLGGGVTSSDFIAPAAVVMEIQAVASSTLAPPDLSELPTTRVSPPESSSGALPPKAEVTVKDEPWASLASRSHAQSSSTPEMHLSAHDGLADADGATIDHERDAELPVSVLEEAGYPATSVAAHADAAPEHQSADTQVVSAELSDSNNSDGKPAAIASEARTNNMQLSMPLPQNFRNEHVPFEHAVADSRKVVEQQLNSAVTGTPVAVTATMEVGATLAPAPFSLLTQSTDADESVDFGQPIYPDPPLYCESPSSPATGTAPAAPPQIAPGLEIPLALQADYERLKARQRHPAARVLLVALGIIGILALLAQYAYFMPDDLVRRYPLVRPNVLQYCQYLGCAFSAPEDRRVIELLSRNVRVHPRYEGALQIQAAIVNRGQTAQTFPSIRFTLFNVNGGVIASRLFTPREYLDAESVSGARQLSLFPAGQLTQIQLDLVAPEDTAVSFEFEFI